MENFEEPLARARIEKMQIILASAKIMNDRVKLIPDISLSMPRFQNEAEGFAREIMDYLISLWSAPAFGCYYDQIHH